MAATRRAAVRRSMARPWLRSYATQEQAEGEKTASEEKPSSSSSEPSAEQKELQQCREKLKAKEQEAVDLTVRSNVITMKETCLQRVYRAVYDIFRQIS